MKKSKVTKPALPPITRGRKWCKGSDGGKKERAKKAKKIPTPEVCVRAKPVQVIRLITKYNPITAPNPPHTDDAKTGSYQSLGDSPNIRAASHWKPVAKPHTPKVIQSSFLITPKSPERFFLNGFFGDR